MSFVIFALYTNKQKSKRTSSSCIRTLTDGVTGVQWNRCTNYFHLSLCVSITFYEIKSNTRMSIKYPQTPELAYDCFRTVMSATSNINDNTIIFDFEICIMSRQVSVTYGGWFVPCRIIVFSGRKGTTRKVAMRKPDKITFWWVFAWRPFAFSPRKHVYTTWHKSATIVTKG